MTGEEIDAIAHRVYEVQVREQGLFALCFLAIVGLGYLIAWLVRR